MTIVCRDAVEHQLGVEKSTEGNARAYEIRKRTFHTRRSDSRVIAVVAVHLLDGAEELKDDSNDDNTEEL